jgi:hypothetical protein
MRIIWLLVADLWDWIASRVQRFHNSLPSPLQQTLYGILSAIVLSAFGAIVRNWALAFLLFGLIMVIFTVRWIVRN